jgi:hypothetical protein
MNKELFNDAEKKELYVNRKKYIFYTKFNFSRYNRTVTFQVDEEDNIINAFAGSFSYLDNNILTIDDDCQHCSYYDINTGEVLFKDFDNRRCHSDFINGIAIAYNDKINQYEVFNSNSEIIGTCACLYRINKNTLLVKHDSYNSMLSLYDYNFKPIKKYVTYDYDNMHNMYSKDYVLCSEDNQKNKHNFFIIDTKGNKVSDEYYTLKTNDFITFTGVKNKGDKTSKFNIDDIINV